MSEFDAIYTDAEKFDGFWLRTLLEQSSHKQESYSFEIKSIYSLIDDDETLYRLFEIYSQQKRPHDALEDCRMIADGLLQVLKENKNL